MNADELLRFYERVADAADAVARLRRFVLDLAVRGKLVPQDAIEQPAAQLLVQIAAEKALRVKAGGIREPKPLPPDEEAPFPIAATWRWTQLAEIGLISPRNEEADATVSSFVPMTLIAAEYGVEHRHEVRAWGEIKKGYTHFADGDVGLAKITPCFENGKSTVFRNLTAGLGSGTTELHVVRPLLVVPDYILLFLKCPHFIEAGIPRMTGTAGQKRVPADYFAHAPFPLPPLAEQHRIVAKVDELMALCDRLDAARAIREAARDRLAAASLARLNAPDPENFHEDARFALDALPALTTRPDQIKQFRQTILNFAVRGLLVPQQSTAGSMRIPARVAVGFDEEVFEYHSTAIALPAGWKIAPLAQVSDHVVDCPHSTPVWTERGEICVRTNQLRPRFLDLSESRYVSRETYLQRIERLEPRQDDILYSREGGILGVACRVPTGVRLCLGQRLMLIRPSVEVASVFLELVLNSPFITGIAKQRTTGGAAPRVNMSTVRGFPIPLPPLTEQHRIVGKVDELMALCDRLEASLASTDTHRRRLLEALLHNALQPSNLALATA